MADPLPTETTAVMVAQVEAEQKAFRAHPWWAIEQEYVLTLEEDPPTGVPPIKPLPPKEYLKACVDLWLSSRRIIICKSRQVMLSWLFSYLQYWDSMVNTGRHCVIQGKRLDDVDAKNPHRILGRVRHIRHYMPAWLQPEVVQEDTRSETYRNDSTIEAIPEGADIVRGKVPSSMFMDELAFHNESEESWNAALASTKRLCGVTTPNGIEFVCKQADPGRPWQRWRDWPQVAPGVYSYRNQRGITLVFIHYTADEEKRTRQFQARLREGYTDEQRYRRENEGDFSIRAGEAVYAKQFRRSLHVIEHYEVDPTQPIYRGWDISYLGQAISFFQRNARGQLVWFDQVLLKAVPLPQVAQEVLARTHKYLGRAAMEIRPTGDNIYTPHDVYDYGEEPAKAHQADGITPQQTLANFGIRLVTIRVTGRKQDLVDRPRDLLLPRNDGTPGLVVALNSPEMETVVAGFEGGYHFPDSQSGKATKELPEKDGVFDHIFDSAQHAIDRIVPFVQRQDEGNEWWRDVDTGVGADDYGVE